MTSNNDENPAATDVAARAARWREHDPEAVAEARKYGAPLPSRRFLLELLADLPGPLDAASLGRMLGLDHEGQGGLRARLGAMVRDGQLVRDRRGDFGVAGRMNLVRGRISAHPDGFGFLLPEDGSDDLFLAPRQMRTLMHGDRVLARVAGIDHRGRREAPSARAPSARRWPPASAPRAAPTRARSRRATWW